MKRRIAMVLVLALMLAMLPALTATTAQAATRKETRRVIGIVFDNSGSMYNPYTDGTANKSWCQATYAVEVFAAMLNSTDELRIYPMWPIQIGIGGPTYSKQNPLVIQGPSQSSMVRQIYTPEAGGTPGNTINYAYDDLAAASGFDEKHLIVLTDGVMDEVYSSGSEQWLVDVLDDCARGGMDQVMYLAVGPGALPLEETCDNQYFAKSNQSEDVLMELTAMCNQIFGRHQLVCPSETTLTFDVSMSKVIIFAQGANVTNAEVQGWDQTSRVPMQYSELGAGGRVSTVDYSLQGVIVTYEGELNKGTYTVNYTGEYDSVCIYYEPDVDIQVRIMGADGEVDPSSNLYAGEYTVEFYMVDREGDIVTSELMGDVEFEINFTKNGVTESQTFSAKSGSVELVVEEGDTLEMEFVASYLDGYEIRKDGGDFGWPSNGLLIEKDPSRDLFIEITGGADKYPLTKLEDEAVYHVALFHDGKQLTGEELKAVQEPIDIALGGGNAEYTVERTDSGYEIRVRYHNSAKDTDVGEYTLTVSATFVNKEGEIITCKPVTKTFTIEDDAGKFEAKMEVPQDYYVLKNIESGKPIYINLTCGGAPLTAEQFQAAKVTVDLGGVPYEITPDEANSRYIIVLKSGEGITGKHTFTMRAEGYDEIGRAVTCEDSHKVEIQTYPEAFKWIFWILVAIATVILILLIRKFILSIKRLPKRIDAERVTFTVCGSSFAGDLRVDYSLDRRVSLMKNYATLTIRGPEVPTSSDANACGLELKLVAVSCFLTQSSEREFGIYSVRPLNSTKTESVSCGGFHMTRNRENRLVWEDTENPIEQETRDIYTTGGGFEVEVVDRTVKYLNGVALKKKIVLTANIITY